MIDRFEKFSLAISEISRYWHKIAAEELNKYGLKSAHATYLTTMSRFPDGITAPKLAELCGKDKADVSRMMSIMDKKGLITKVGSHPKLYRGYLKLTEEGKAVARQIRKRAELAVERAGIGLTEEARAVFYDSLEVITRNLKQICESGL